MNSMGQIRQGVKSRAEEVRLSNREPMKLPSKGRGVLKAVAFKEG